MTLPDDVRDWPADALDAYRERVAIMVIDGGLEQRRAMHEAEARVRREWARRDATRAALGVYSEAVSLMRQAQALARQGEAPQTLAGARLVEDAVEWTRREPVTPPDDEARG
jgi:hypothetical protein